MKLNTPLTADQIQTMRNVVDFYYWHGIPVARTWPKRPTQPNTPAQVTTRARMRTACAIAKSAPASWIKAWHSQPLTIGRTYRDHYIAALLRWQAYATIPPLPDIIDATLTPGPAGVGSIFSLHFGTSPTCPRAAWRALLRAQPPTEPAITHYDAGWHRDRCRALYRDYRPIWSGFRAYDWQDDESPDSWRITMPTLPETVSWIMVPTVNPQPPLDLTDALWPPTKASLTHA